MELGKGQRLELGGGQLVQVLLLEPQSSGLRSGESWVTLARAAVSLWQRRPVVWCKRRRGRAGVMRFSGESCAGNEVMGREQSGPVCWPVWILRSVGERVGRGCRQRSQSR